MKILGKRSIATVLKVAINFLWYFVLFVFSGIFVAFVVIFFFTGTSYEIHGWPVHIEPSPTAFEIQSKNQEHSVIEVQVEKTELSFKTERDWQTITMRFTDLVVGGGMILMLIHLLRSVIGTLIINKPFVWENVIRFRKMAVLIILLPFFEAIRGLFISMYIRANFTIARPLKHLGMWDLGAAGDFFRHFDLGWIFLGLVFLVLAEIFRSGLQYKEDSESIV